MADQNAGGGPSEVLNVRWATEDPNPKAIEHKKRKNIEAVEEHLAKKGFTDTGQACFEYPLDYKLQPAATDQASSVGDRQNSGDGDYWSKYYEQQAAAMDSTLSYPDTDAQFEAALDRADMAARKEATTTNDHHEREGHGAATADIAAGMPQGYSSAEIFGDISSTAVGEGDPSSGQRASPADSATQLQQQWAAYYQQQQWAAYYQQKQAWERQMQAGATGTSTVPRAAQWPSANSTAGTTTGTVAAVAEAAPTRNIGPRPPPSSR